MVKAKRYFLKSMGAENALQLPLTISMDFAAGALRLTAKKDPASKLQPFLATITYAGAVSDGCVGGTETIEGGPYRVFIGTALMTGKVESLVKKGVFVAETLDTHEGTQRCGEFLDAWLERIPGTEIHDVRASGLLDHGSIDEELMAKIIDRARAMELGFSYDIKDIVGHLDDQIVTGEKIFVVDDFKWRGATILRREAAAYHWTRLAAARPTVAPAAQAPGSQPNRSLEATTLTEEQIRALMVTVLAAALAPLNTSLTELKTKQTEIETRLPAAAAAVVPPAAAAPAAFDMAAFGTMLGAQLTAANKPLLDAIKLITPVEPEVGTGKRITFSASQLSTVSRWKEEGEADPGSLEAIESAINTLKASKGSARSIEAGLNVLVPMRHELLRAQQRQNAAQGVN